ncbi:MAG: Rieske 2Fe-2S domain-containing protein [Pseudomonadota bacterium]
MSADPSPAAWVPIALSDKLAAGEVMRVETAGRDLAVWRANAGTVQCVDNRCPHRGMRLSFGFVRGNRLNCIYHGWQYGTSGACQYIPAHPDLEPPASLCVPTLPCAESGGLVWISLDSETTPPNAVQSAAALRSLAVNASLETIQSQLHADPLPSTTDPTHGCSATLRSTHEQQVHLDLCLVDGQTHALVLWLQPATGGKSWVHAQLAADCDTASRIAVSRWLEALRRSIEAPA